MGNENKKQEGQGVLKGKIMIKAVLHVETGLHIGAAKDFAPIGAVDSPFIRDPFTKKPIIPGSSLKGKIRTLLAKSVAIGPMLNAVDQDDIQIKLLFGAAGEGKKVPSKPARLQFFDLQMTEESFKRFDAMELDTYIGEVKFENSIDRILASANPRQIERVPAGAEFDFKLVYNVENKAELLNDMETLIKGLRLLQMDYLGGHGSRGYGRVSLHDFAMEVFALHEADKNDIEKTLDEGNITEKMRGCRLS